MKSSHYITSVETRVSNLETKFEAFMRAHEDFKTEMRQQNEMRAAEIRELRQKHDADMREMNQRFYAKFDAMDTKFDRLGDKIQNMVIAAVVGFGAIAAAVGGIVYAALK